MTYWLSPEVITFLAYSKDALPNVKSLSVANESGSTRYTPISEDTSARAMILSPCFSKTGMSYPESFRSKDHTWYGFAARARVLLVNHDRVARKDWPQHLWDLTDKKWKGQIENQEL